MKDTETMDQPREVISINHLWAGYGKGAVLEDITLSVRELDFIGLIGPNGGGKTTLLKVLLGLLTPSRGEVHIMGRPVAEGRRHVGYVPQLAQFDRDFPIRVWDVVRMGRLGKRRLLQRLSSEDDEIVAQALRSVDMLPSRDRPIGELSGGQRQRVYIARALATDPKILFLDEPMASVDLQVRTSIYELLQRLNQHITILIVSHDVSAISTYVKSVGCLNRRLFFHGGSELTRDMLEAVYQCPIDLIAHGVPHRVFPEHMADAAPNRETVHDDGTDQAITHRDTGR